MCDPATWGSNTACMSPGIGHSWEKKVLGVVFGDGVGFRLGRLGVITTEDHERFSIGSEDDRMGSMFAATLQSTQFGDLVELVVCVGVREVVKPTAMPAYAASVHADIETIKCPEQSMASADWSGHLFHLQLLAEGYPPNPCLALIAAVEAALIVYGHGDP